MRRPSQQVAQLGDQGDIGGRHFVGAHVFRPHPSQGLPLLRSDKAFPAPAKVKRHQEVKTFVTMRSESERRETVFLHADAQFFVQLADEGLFGTLARFDLAAGKFPQTGHRFALGALREQHAAIGVDEGASRDEDEFGLAIGHRRSLTDLAREENRVRVARSRCLVVIAMPRAAPVDLIGCGSPVV